MEKEVEEVAVEADCGVFLETSKLPGQP